MANSLYVRAPTRKLDYSYFKISIKGEQFLKPVLSFIVNRAILIKLINKPNNYSTTTYNPTIFHVKNRGLILQSSRVFDAVHRTFAGLLQSWKIKIKPVIVLVISSYFSGEKDWKHWIKQILVSKNWYWICHSGIRVVSLKLWLNRNLMTRNGFAESGLMW